jgi:hypothetical protein
MTDDSNPRGARQTLFERKQQMMINLKLTVEDLRHLGTGCSWFDQHEMDDGGPTIFMLDGFGADFIMIREIVKSLGHEVLACIDMMDGDLGVIASFTMKEYYELVSPSGAEWPRYLKDRQETRKKKGIRGWKKLPENTMQFVMDSVYSDAQYDNFLTKIKARYKV